MEFIEIDKFYILLFPLIIGTFIWLLKFFVFYYRHNFDWNYAIKHGITYGHMPSAHTGFVTALATSIGCYTGISSGSFAVSFAFAIVIIDDALHLRIYMGDQGKRLNLITRQMNMSEKDFPRLKERVGHRKSEVLVGGILGFLLTFILIKLFG